jgi:hypothetical protein
MVDLVLEDPGDKPFGADSDAPAVQEDALDAYTECTAHGRDDPGDAETTFFRGGAARSAAQKRVQERQQSVPGVGDKHATRDPNLRRGESDALGVSHGDRHVRNQTGKSRVDRGYRVAPPPQHRSSRIGDGNDPADPPAGSPWLRRGGRSVNGASLHPRL